MAMGVRENVRKEAIRKPKSSLTVTEHVTKTVHTDYLKISIEKTELAKRCGYEGYEIGEVEDDDSCVLMQLTKITVEQSAEDLELDE